MNLDVVGIGSPIMDTIYTNKGSVRSVGGSSVNTIVALRIQIPRMILNLPK